MTPELAEIVRSLQGRSGFAELDVAPPADDQVLPPGAAIVNFYRIAGQTPATFIVTENESRLLHAAGAAWKGPINETPAQRDFLDAIEVRGLGCVKHATFPLTPLHALIGPNDSGKSTLLRAIGGGLMGSVILDPNDGSRIVGRIGIHTRAFVPRSGSVLLEPGSSADGRLRLVSNQALINATAAVLGPVRLLKLDPDAMREPCMLIPNGQPMEFQPTGRGLAAVYDSLLSRNLGAIKEISAKFCELFPSIRAIELTNHSNSTKQIGVQLRSGESIHAGAMSEGMLYWLAFAMLPYVSPVAMVMLEEPENGLHPSRIAEVMRALRKLSKSTQVCIATHSPLVVNELHPDEVTIVTRPDNLGTQTTPLTNTKNFKERRKVYALGEIWLNYADGNLEAELVS